MAIQTVTVKYDGQYHEILFAELDLNRDTATDAQIKAAVATQLGTNALNEFVVEPAEGEPSRALATVLNIRPTATFGV